MVLEIDENNYIVRVQSEPAADEPVPPDSSVVVRGHRPRCKPAI